MEEVKKVPDEETGGGRQNTMKILDKREEAWEEKKKSDGWNGYHILFTETTQFLIIWEDMKKKLKIAYFATLAFLILFVVCLGGAGIWNFIESALLSAVVPIIYGLFCRDDIYLKVFDPARDQGALYLPEEMTWEEAVGCDSPRICSARSRANHRYSGHSGVPQQKVRSISGSEYRKWSQTQYFECPQ